MLVAGVEDGVPQLYWIDFLASMVELPKAAHGYSSSETLFVQNALQSVF